MNNWNLIAKREYIGMTSINRMGIKMQIVDYEDSHNVTIEFEDGTRVYNKEVYNFRTGYIEHPKHPYKKSVTKEDIIGLKKVHEVTGMQMEIINAYKVNKNKHSAWYIDILFEDGVVAYNKSYTAFKYGSIGHPVLRKQRKGITESDLIDTEKVHEKTGLKMRIIKAYKEKRSSVSGYRWFVDVKFEDGQVVYGAYYSQFRDNIIDHPILTKVKLSSIKRAEEIIGLEAVNKKGMRARVTGCSPTSRKLEITFEDGTVGECWSLTGFKNGEFKYPIEHIGEKILCHNGLEATVIEFNKSNDIVVQFEDGNKSRIRYSNFIQGAVGHPKFKKVKEAYQYEGIKYFLCTCKKCKNKHVLKLSEMKDFECKDVYV